MINITLPDGSVREYEQGTTAYQIALSISEGLARNVLAAMVNGEVWDSSRPIEKDSLVKLLTWNDQEGKATFWHSSAHLMGVQRPTSMISRMICQTWKRMIGSMQG